MIDPPTTRAMAVDQDMRRIREAVLLMGEHVENAITRAAAALQRREIEACTDVISGDARVNQLQTEVRDRCFTVILTQAPVAGDLREVMGFFHMAMELERMGDHCVSIAKIVKRLVDIPPIEPPVDVSTLADRCADQVRDVLVALVSRDVDAARVVAARDDRIDRVYHRLFDELVQLGEDDGANVYRATSLIFIAHHFERIADRVTNLAEDLVFLETGAIEELD